MNQTSRASRRTFLTASCIVAILAGASGCSADSSDDEEEGDAFEAAAADLNSRNYSNVSSEWAYPNTTNLTRFEQRFRIDEVANNRSWVTVTELTALHGGLHIMLANTLRARGAVGRTASFGGDGVIATDGKGCHEIEFGRQCGISYAFVPGREYVISIRRVSEDTATAGAWWEGQIVDSVTRATTTIAKLQVPKDAGFIKSSRNLSVLAEGSRTSCQEIAISRATWWPPVASSVSTPGTFTAEAGATNTMLKPACVKATAVPFGAVIVHSVGSKPRSTSGSTAR